MSIFFCRGEVRFMSNAFIVAMGIGTVFVGLICIVILCKILGAICCAAEKNVHTEETAPAAEAPKVIENRQEIIAAVSAVLAEEMGTDVSAIRIHSFRKI